MLFAWESTSVNSESDLISGDTISVVETIIPKFYLKSSGMGATKKYLLEFFRAARSLEGERIDLWRLSRQCKMREHPVTSHDCLLREGVAQLGEVEEKGEINHI